MVTDQEFQELKAMVESIMPYFEQAPPPDDQPQLSWPIPDEALGMDQLMSMFRHQYGIMDRGGRPYWLRNNGTVANTNSTNTMLLTVSTTTGDAEATLSGVFHRMTEDLVLEFPMPLSETTYHVCLQYDPLRALPLLPGVFTVLDYTQGKKYIPLWEVTRKPSQLLTDATIVQRRPRAVQRVSVDTYDQLPDPRNVLWGTEATITHGDEAGTMYMAWGGSSETSAPTRWENMTDPPWIESTSNAHIWHGTGPKPSWRRIGNRVELRGHVKRSSGATYGPGTADNQYTLIPNAPAPKIATRAKAWGAGYGNVHVVNVLCDPGGAPLFLPSRETSWIDLGGVYYWLE